MSNVVVLGAGFTKAFYPSAPLLEDEYPLRGLIERYPSLSTANRILETEIATSDAGKVNLERLITRLSSPMPYDRSSRARAELELALDEVESMFAERLLAARQNPGEHVGVLAALAEKWLEDRTHCMSFNYDDIVDEKLWRVRGLRRFNDVEDGVAYWHPDGGYGFFCQPASITVTTTDTSMDLPTTLLLKLHGSLNWYVRRGASHPLRLADVVHFEEWLPFDGEDDDDLPVFPPRAEIRTHVPDHLEPRSFIVAPILAKTRIAEEPVLQHVWTLARDKLEAADRVTFVGYSFPPTDLAARFLFSEAIAPSRRRDIHIVDYAQPEDEVTRHRVLSAYRSVFGHLEAEQFEWNGAVEWASREVEGGVGDLTPTIR